MLKKGCESPVKFYGFYELDPNGTIFYAESGDENLQHQSIENLIGQNFFNAILQCRNADELKQSYLNFISTGYTSKSFTFGAEVGDHIMPLRILFVRVWRNASVHSEPVYFLDIKPESDKSLLRRSCR